MSQINQIRVDEVDGGVSHYATKYYHVSFNESIQTDELYITSSNKVISTVIAVGQDNKIITYRQSAKV